MPFDKLMANVISSATMFAVLVEVRFETVIPN